jgi:hypothetical protein
VRYDKVIGENDEVVYDTQLCTCPGLEHRHEEERQALERARREGWGHWRTQAMWREIRAHVNRTWPRRPRSPRTSAQGSPCCCAQAKWVSPEVRRGSGRGCVPEPGEVDGAGGVQGFLWGACWEAGAQEGVFVAVAGGGVDREAE